MNRTIRVLTRAALVVLAASAAYADVDVETGPSVKGKSTLLPAGETETYRFQATADSTLTFTLTQLGRAKLQFVPTLFDPQGPPIALGADVMKTTKTGVVVRNLPLQLTGGYRLDVTA